MTVIVEVLGDGLNISDTAGVFEVKGLREVEVLYRLLAVANKYPLEQAIVYHSKPCKLLVYKGHDNRNQGILITPEIGATDMPEEAEIQSLFSDK